MSPNRGSAFTRREFLGASTGTLGVLFSQAPLLGADLGQELPTHRFRARRDSDLLSLEFSFVNFERRGGLLHSLGGGRSLVIVRFPPQNLAEARFDKEAELPTEPNKKPQQEAPNPKWEEHPLSLPKEGQSKYSPIPPIASFLSGPSWVVFSVPDHIDVPLTLKAAESLREKCALPITRARSILDVWLHTMGDWPIRVPANAVQPGRPSMPGSDETCLEIPFRLFISPRTKSAKWITSSTPQLPFVGPEKSSVELWHAALHDRTKLMPATPPPDIDVSKLPPELAPPKRTTLQTRAVFSPDYQERDSPPWQQFYPGKLPLSHRALVRHLLVKQMTEGAGDGWIDAEHLVLSALGANANLSYYMQKTFREIHDEQLKNNDPNAGTSLAIWKHRMVVGRDVFLLSVWTGFMFPFVFPALLVELTRRTFVSRRMSREGDNFGPPGAYLLTEYFILVQDPVKQFSDSDNVLGRKMPIKKATLLETRSPLIQVPTDIQEPFVPQALAGGTKVRWPIEFEDDSGRRSKTTDACLLFSANVVKGHKAWPDQPLDVRRWSLPAQRIGMAPDKPQLIVPASNGNAARAFTLRDDERLPAKNIAEAFRNQSETAIEQLEQLKRANSGLATLPAAIRDRLSGVREDSRKFIEQLANELSAPAKCAEDVTGQVLSLLHAADRLEKHVFDPKEEVKAAKELARLLRDELNQGKWQLARLQTALAGLPGTLMEFTQPCQNEIQKFTPATIQHLGDVSRELGNSVAVAQRAVDNILRQLNRAEQAAADVEVHALEFGSRRVNDLLTKLEGGIPQILKDAGSANEFVDKLQLLIPVEQIAELQKIRREVGALWSGMSNDWQQQKREALGFLENLKSEADKARNFLRHGFQPELVSAEIIVPALKAMGGAAAPKEFRLLEEYAAKGIDKIQNSVFGGFAETIDEGRAMADRIKCAVASPAAQVAGLSRDLGAIVGEGQAALNKLALQEDNFDLSSAIPDFKLLGVLPLSKILSSVLSGAEIPTINLVTLPDHLEQIWEWNARLKDVDLNLLKFVTSPKGAQNKPNPRKEPVHLYIKMTTRIDIPKPGQLVEGAQPQGRVKLEGLISYWNRSAKKPIPINEEDNVFAFSLNLLGLIDIKFIDVSFDANYSVGENPKPKVKPRLGVVEFLPPLDFIKKLQEMLPFLGKGFDIVQTPGRIGISYEFAIPGIAFGVFSLRNLAIGSSVLFSLEGKPLRFDFNFSSWKEPFELTVMCFGGRGFLKVAADTSGYRDLQGMIEFGGALSFDVVVASGGLYVMAGLYFRINSESTTIAGFVRAGGCLNVLGLIRASVEFLLMLSYVRTARGSKLAGEASVTVSIDLFLVSFNVTVRMYKEFAGSESASDQGTALDLRGRGNLQYVALQWPAAPPQKPAPLAYITRPAVAGTPIDGRFHNEQHWIQDYWSQFAL